ncbi:MAG: hypothetical protein LBH22_02760 [Bacteroidales bacterium]|jgi:hypothetical protein|nr:hypothetical protein [Bacteroidales bacterium]
MQRKPKPSENKSRRVNLRLTEKEYALILQRAEQFGQKDISRYVRKHLFNQKMYVETHDTTGEKFNIAVCTYTQQIRKIGQNYNQITRYLQANWSPEDTKMLLREIEKMTKIILKYTVSLNEIAKKALEYYDRINQQKQ